MLRYCWGTRKFQCELTNATGGARTHSQLLHNLFHRSDSSSAHWEAQLRQVILTLNATDVWVLHTIGLVEVEIELSRLRSTRPDVEVPRMRSYIAKIFQLMEELLPIPEKGISTTRIA